ncbi:S1C family serine protease [Stackebrandtia endophytica]|uniref:S1C family serine protease n=1 Tax=Stackebrandtia endophytica TaxID=1496996 RepID=UPI0014774F3A|nr:trypsin-like peptidase domain-containing protein [Stackebrandtia endophytica]
MFPPGHVHSDPATAAHPGPVFGPGTTPPVGAPGPVAGRRGGRIAVAVAVAVALALGAGGVGGFVGYSLAESQVTTDSPSALVSDSATLSDVAAAVQPSVVSIGAGQSTGSGVVYDDQGHIITNSHVVASAQGDIEVRFSDGSSSKATLVGMDERGDIAVLKVEDTSNLTPIAVGDSNGLSVGDTVLALGSPLGLDGSVTSGIVSAMDRAISDGSSSLQGLIQTDAAINRGNSGGALVNGRGELIGINTAIATTDSSGGSIGVGFAIPSATATSTADQLIAGGSVERAFLGVSMSAGGGTGAVVTDVQSDSPAADAGLRTGDIITAIDGQPVATPAEVAAAVQARKPGDTVTITYVRDGMSESEATATLSAD